MHAINKIKSILKPTLFRIIIPLHYFITKTINAHGAYFCPVCENNVRQFLPAGSPPRLNAKCPMCGSLERHRLDWFFFIKATDLFDKSRKRMLHIAPEKFFSERLHKLEYLNYLSADKSNPNAMVQMDITSINYPDNFFHVIYCSHVLEHIPDDRKAISELYRVLCQDGWALLQVPVTADETYEDPSIIDPKERISHFGQWDHVRRCGPDYAERIKNVGFVVQVLRANELLSQADCARMGFEANMLVFFCRKTSLTPSEQG